MVEEVGPAVTWFKPGDPVYGYCRRHELEYGTYAEFTTVPEGFLAHMPRRSCPSRRRRRCRWPR